MKGSAIIQKDVSDSVPAYVAHLVQFYRTVYGLADWDVVYDLHDDPAGDGSALGMAYVHARYRTARLVFHRETVHTDPVLTAHIVHHEMIHVVLGLLVESATTIIDGLVKPNYRAHARDVLEQGLEATIELTTRALDATMQGLDTYPSYDADSSEIAWSHEETVEQEPHISDDTA